jgi:hypothetical protein
LTKDSAQPPARDDLDKSEKVRLIAYRLWVARESSNISGDPESDYYQAEQILESYKNWKRLLLGSFSFSTVAFVLGRSPEEHYATALNAVLGVNELELADLYDFSSELGERFLRTLGS